ncbi:nicotinate-nucleotide adenylyltransferase [Gilvimarinus sp. F26214L]|uniref:nicotinate-nucleotide adenylyltransferase n=1 Tax=Gilvimarinus sp. DZF01 TaxID=3461371 RepID=UPI0040452BB3
MRQLIGLFGGTFDPVHFGHLRLALELKQHLGMDEMRLVPCHIPPHRQAPVADAEQRAHMVELAVADCPDLLVDRLELDNPEPSYSVHTLEALRAQLGPEPALCLAMGMDSLSSLNRWYRWERLLELAHIAVVSRPGWKLPADGFLADYVAQHRGDAGALRREPAGRLVIEELSLLPISSTAIRAQIGRGESPQFLLPDTVWAYILRNHLYRQS